MREQTPIVLACLDKEIIGYLVYDVVPECYLFEHLFVRPDYRGQFIGSVLMKNLTDKIKGPDNGFLRNYIMCFIEDFLGEGIDKVKFLRKMGFMVVEYADDAVILHYSRPEANVLRIVTSDRMKPYYPESLHYEVDDDSEG